MSFSSPVYMSAHSNITIPQVCTNMCFLLLTARYRNKSTDFLSFRGDGFRLSQDQNILDLVTWWKQTRKTVSLLANDMNQLLQQLIHRTRNLKNLNTRLRCFVIVIIILYTNSSELGDNCFTCCTIIYIFGRLVA